VRRKFRLITVMWRNRHRILAAAYAANNHGDRRRAAQLEIHRILREAGL
jgi:hypothetical protein